MLNRAEMLNRRASNPKFKVDEIINILSLEKGNVVADIGCGGGYISMRLAGKVGLDGKVYAVDANKNMLDYVNTLAKDNQMTNLETVLVDENGLKLPAQSCDLIFLRDVFHHIEDRKSYFLTLKSYLKPNGKVVIIDYKKSNSFSFINLMKHYVKEELIQETLKEAGYVLIESFDFLPEQSFNIFEK